MFAFYLSSKASVIIIFCISRSACTMSSSLFHETHEKAYQCYSEEGRLQSEGKLLLFLLFTITGSSQQTQECLSSNAL